MSKLPPRVRIFGRSFSVTKAKLDEELAGACIPQEQKIFITTGMTPVEEIDTALHEVVHCIDYLMNLDMTEEQVRGLATGLIGVFLDNPKFAHYLINHE